MKTLANTTILSNLASVGRLDLLRQLHRQLYVPNQVYEEILHGLEEGYGFYASIEDHMCPFAKDGWIELVSMVDGDELALFHSLTHRLHFGEAACIAIARQRNWAFLTDDKRARKTAHDLGIVVSGTLGTLVQAVNRGLLTLEYGNELLGEMITRGYRSPYGSLDPLVEMS